MGIYGVNGVNQIDTSLLQTGKAADAKAVGDKFAEVIDILPSVTASGAVASFTDGADYPAESVLANIDPVQSGSGDPSPTNVRPITGRTAVSVGAAGENFYTGLYGNLAYSNGYIRSLSTSRGIWARVVEGESYTVIRQKMETNRFYVCTTVNEPTNDEPVTSAVNAAASHSASITVPEGSNYIFVFVSSQSEAVNVDNYLIVKTSSLTNYTAQLGQTVYGGTLDIVSGALTINCARVKISDLTWTYQSDQTRFFTNSLRNDIAPSADQSTLPDLFLCECYKATAFYGYSDGNIAVAASGNLFVKDSDYIDTPAWLAAVGDNYLVYPLANPTTVQLTSRQVNILLGENNIWVYNGDISVIYEADIKRYIDKMIATAINV